jgi:hypothetical protein
VPAGGCKPTEQACPAGLLVEMHRLRIELAREFDDLGGGDLLGPERDDFARGKILEGAHTGCHVVSVQA